MDEAKRVAYHDAHRDDAQEFIEVAETPTTRKRESLSVTVAVRFSAAEVNALQRAAQIEGKTYSEIIRTAVHRYTQPDMLSLPTGNITLTGMGVDSPQTQRESAPSSVDIVGPHADTQTISSGAASTARLTQDR